MSRRSHVTLLATLALTAAAFGCGNSAESTTTTTAAAEPAGTKSAEAKERPKGVSEKQIAGAPVGSPERAVLEWWRDVQVNDPEHARGLYAEPPTLPNLAGQFNLVAGHLEGNIEVVAVTEEGDRAVAKVRWSRSDGAERNVTLRLQELDGGWGLLGARFLDEMVVELQAGGGAG